MVSLSLTLPAKKEKASKMVFLVVDRAYLVLESDLPPALRAIHPSGVLHVRCVGTNGSGGGGDNGNGQKQEQQRDAFTWIDNTLHVEAALSHLENRGFNVRAGAAGNVCEFLPFSSRENWEKSHPHAILTAEVDREGRVSSYNPLQGAAASAAIAAADRAAARMASAVGGDGSNDDDGEGGDENMSGSRKRGSNKRKRTDGNVVRDRSCLNDAERDELHVEIYNYLSWLRRRMTDVGKAEGQGGGEGDGGEKTRIKFMNLDAMGTVIDGLGDSFQVVAQIRKELQLREETAERDGTEPATNLGDDGKPFLEDGLGPALARLVEARGAAGLGRRSRMKERPKSNIRNRIHGRKLHSFEDMFARLKKYWEENGDCMVFQSVDRDLNLFVQGVRAKRKVNVKKGYTDGIEEMPPDGKLGPKTLTAERIQRLDAMGFTWNPLDPHVPWEDRFEALCDYYSEHGKWPSQSVPGIGEWTHRMRSHYASKCKSFMQTKAPRLDAIGFDWTPRGYTRMSWDEGFEMLLAFGRLNGHFDVPMPPKHESNIVENGKAVKGKKSVAHRLYAVSMPCSFSSSCSI